MKVTQEQLIQMINEELDALDEFQVEKRKLRDIPIEERSKVVSMFLGGVIKKATQLAGDKLNAEDDELYEIRNEIQRLLFGIMDDGTNIVSVEMAERIAEIYLGKKELGNI